VSSPAPGRARDAPPARLVSVGIDSPDPVAGARWWADALGWQIVAAASDEAEIAPRAGGTLALVFLPVPEPKTVKNRLHLDVASRDDADQQATVDRLLAVGATRADIGQRDVPWVVLADPHGNEFCVLDPRDRYRDTGRLAAVVVDAVDPPRLARYWAGVTGWQIGLERDGITSLRHPSNRPPDLDFVRVPDAKEGKNRLHLDVVAPGAVDAHADRLVAAGARSVDVGQGAVPWAVLADPEGNEFCVLPETIN
jgi:predicted enzyme related to lactoylglutathione lyase